METFRDYFRNYLRKINSLSDATVTQYISIYNEYEKYSEGKDLSLKDNDLYMNQSKKWCLIRCNKHWNNYIDYLRSNGNKNSSIKQKFSKIKAVNKSIEQEMGIKLHIPEVKLKTNTPPVFSWSPEYTMDFLRADINEKKRILALMKLHIATCYRPSDVLSIKSNNFKERDGVYYIEMLTQKTNKVISSIISEKIWKEAYFYADNYYTVSPYSDLLKYNRDIKEVMAMVAANLDVTVYDTDSNGRIIERQSTYIDETTPHTLRKTEINLLLHWGVDEKTVMRNYSGHTNENTFNKYYVSHDNRNSIDIIKQRTNEI